MPLLISVLAYFSSWAFCDMIIDCFILCVCCFQKDAMENSVEIVIEKLLNVTKDTVPKVTNFILFVFVFHIISFFC